MTANQIAYWNLQENKRHNRSVETETNRSNVARETETNRSNKAREFQTFQQRMQDRELKRIDQRELERSHRATEWRDYWALEETKRHNKAVEEAGQRQATAQLQQAETSRLLAHEQIRSNQVKERQSENRIAAQNYSDVHRVYQAYYANDLQAAYTYGNLAETHRSNLVEEELKRLGILAEEYRNTEITRHNLANEQETKRHNQEQERIQHSGNVINMAGLLERFSSNRAANKQRREASYLNFIGRSIG